MKRTAHMFIQLKYTFLIKSYEHPTHVKHKNKHFNNIHLKI